MPRKKDENEAAFATLQELLRRDAKRDGLPVELELVPEKLSYRVEAGRKGGLKSKCASTTKKRKEIATKAAKTRWAKSESIP